MIMEDINYKKQDENAIKAFIKKSGGEVEVKEIIIKSGASKLRVYSILFEMASRGEISITRQSELGTPEAVNSVQ